MKGTKQVIDALISALSHEVVAGNQLFLHAKMLKHWGYRRLAEHVRSEALDEMRHADMLMDRILFLEGVPALDTTEQPMIGTTVTDQLENDLALELKAVKQLNDAIATSRTKGDNASVELLMRILLSEEEHVRWIETQLSLLQKLGESAYLQAQLRE